MKELSIEDKAKRYDEAIEKLRNAFYDNSRMCEEYRDAVIRILETIFTELKESEDERIKKEIIAFITTTPKARNSHKKWIAWLEKQGEQKSIEWSGKISSKHADGKLKEMLDNKEKPAWSEDVQQWIDAIIKDYEEWYDVNKDHRATIQVKINILKSLKDRYAWKPSDEQMEALDDFIYAKYPNIEKHGAAVKSLYQDLKKLKVE